MARRRIELRLIENRTSRLARFSKRRAGLLKKAREIAVLCDAEVGVIIFSPLGKLTQFSSQASMEKTIQRYQNFLETGSSVKKHVHRQSHPKGFACQKVNSEILEVAQRLSDGESTVKLTAYELERLQEQLGGALRQVKARLMNLSMNSIKDLQGREKALLQERRELQLALGKDVDEGDGGRNETAERQSLGTKNCERDSFRKSNIEGCHGSDDALALQLWCPPI